MASPARIDELKKKFDENPRRYFAPLANEYRKAGDPDQAIAICREFLPQQPGHMSGHIVYGQALFDAQQFEEAKSVFDMALSLDPENLIALRYLGDISRGLGDFDSARAWYQRVLDADPRNEEIAAVLTSLAEAAPAPATARDAAPEAVEAAGTGPSGMATIGELSLPELEPVQPAGAEEATVAAEPPVLESAVPEIEPVLPTPHLELPTPEPEPTASARASEARPEPPAAAPPAEELLDLDDVRIVSETPVVPRVSTPRASLQSLGMEFERADDEMFTGEPERIETADDRGDEPAAASAEAIAAINGLDAEMEIPGDTEPVAASEPSPAWDAPTSAVGGLSNLAVGASEAPESPVVAEAEKRSDPFATETMAELYMSQGHYGDALRVYRQMLDARPGDLGLHAKIERVEAMMAPTPAIPMAAIPAPEALEASEAPVAHAPESPQALVEAPSGPMPDGGLSIREFLSGLAAWMPRSGADVTQSDPIVEAVVVEEQSVAVSEESVDLFSAGAPDAGPTLAAAHGGTIDTLFGGGGGTAEDQGAAATLAGAFGVVVDDSAAPTPPISGAPARRATT
ncbi:MAG: tetratricopeptide repeat protein, partial [Gemmatimonadaceae bacterium]